MAKRLDPDIRQLAEKMQERRDEAKGRVAAGEIMHLKFLKQDDLIMAIGANLSHVTNNDDPVKHLADLANYGLVLIQKQ